jgi:hypothetical protein
MLHCRSLGGPLVRSLPSNTIVRVIPATGSTGEGALPSLCPNCDYDLRGLSSNRCPECGLLVGNVGALVVPWEFGARMGRTRALWRTIRLATFHPRRLACAIEGAMDRSAALKFQWTVAAIASAVPMLLLGAAMRHLIGLGIFDLYQRQWDWSQAAQSRSWEPQLLWLAGATCIPILPIGAFVTFLLAAGSARMWFGGRALLPERRERGKCLASYACAPLAWSVIPAMLFAGFLILTLWDLDQREWIDSISMILRYAAIGTAVAILGAWWNTSLRLLHRATGCGLGKIAAAAIGLPIEWALCAVIGLGLWPCLAGLIWIAIDGFRG